MLKTRTLLLAWCAGLVVLCVVNPARAGALFPQQVGVGQSAASAEDWKKEFDAVCSRTEDAMTFSPEELTALIQRCDALKPRMEALDETQKKVYLVRLRMCRGLYAYVLDSKNSEKK